MVGLRPYQQQMLDDITEAFRNGAHRICVVAPTGSGKTVVMNHLMAAHPGAALLIHRRELIAQTSKRFAGLTHCVMAPGYPAPIPGNTVIASVATVARRPLAHTPPLVVIDECHHATAASYRAAIGDSRAVGFTATPVRLDGSGLGSIFDALIMGPTTAELIEQGYLSKFRIYAPSTVDMTGVPVTGGDYNKKHTAERVDKRFITGSAVEHYQRLTPGRKAIVSCVSIEHAHHVALSFNEAGIPALALSSKNTHNERADGLAKFAAGRVLALCNCELFGEGIDIPDASVAIMLRPTKSVGLYLQQVGRVLRPHPGKDEAIILDHVGNNELGFPDDDFGWTLASRTRKQDKGKVLSPRVCGNCFSANRAGSRSCVYCDTEFPVDKREIDEMWGELQELQRKQSKRLEESQCRTYDDFLRLAFERQYNYPQRWAKIRADLRARKRNRYSASDYVGGSQARLPTVEE